MADQKKIGRRTFFAGVGLAAAAGAAAKLLSQNPTVEAVAASEPSSDNAAYRLSEHVKKYYRTTTI